MNSPDGRPAERIESGDDPLGSHRIDVRLLGHLEVRGDLGVIPLGGTKQRALLAMLALECNRVVSLDNLISGLWSIHEPSRARNAVQVYVSRLRRVLRAGDSNITLRQRKPGYSLELDPDRIDLIWFDRFSRRGFDLLPNSPELAATQFGLALDLWAGPPLAEFVEEPFAEPQVTRLHELKLTVLTSQLEAQIELGRHLELVGRLEQLVREHPFHEGLRRQLILCLYRSGRQNEALNAYQRAWRVFADELGIDPGPQLRDLEAAILAHDSRLALAKPEYRDSGAYDVQRPTIQLRSLPTRNPHFVGRDELLAHTRSELQASANTPAVRTLIGLGGVGKTEIANEYAHRFADDYDIIWWVDSEQSALIPQQLCRLAQRLGIPDPGTPNESVEPLLNELASRRRWLLIFDNAEDPEDIARYRPDGTGHILVTSRTRRWGALGGRNEVQVLERRDTIKLLQSRVDRLPTELADAIAIELGDLPLAAAQAAAYLEQTGIEPADYLRRFRTHSADLLRQGHVLGYHGKVTSTWSLTLQRLSEESPATVSLMQIAAFLSPEPIPFWLLAEHPDLLQGALRASASAGPDALADTAGVAVGYSLVRPCTDGFQVHRLVQDVVRHQLPADLREAIAGRVTALLAAADPGDPSDPRCWPRYELLAPHVLIAGRLSDGHSGARRLMLAVGEYIHAQGDTRASRAIVERLGRVRWFV